MSEKLSLLDPAPNPLDGTELVYVVQDGESYQAPAQEIADLAPLATGAEVRTGTSAAKAVTPDALFDAAAPVTLTDAATVAVDMAAGINFNLTATGAVGNTRELGSPTNEKPGQSGRIRYTQDATGGRDLTYGAEWKHVGSAPAIDTSADAVNLFAYFVNAAGDVELSYLGALA